MALQQLVQIGVGGELEEGTIKHPRLLLLPHHHQALHHRHPRWPSDSIVGVA